MQEPEKTRLLILGPVIRIVKIPRIDPRPCVVRIPKSACRSTSTANRTVTPTTLLSFPVRLLYNDTTATQKSHDQIYLKIIDQNMSSFFLLIFCCPDQLLRPNRTKL